MLHCIFVFFIFCIFCLYWLNNNKHEHFILYGCSFIDTFIFSIFVWSRMSSSQNSGQYLLNSKPNAWTRSDYILLAFGCLMNFGDGIETHLPGVLTQRVSCELGVDSVQEGIGGVYLGECFLHDSILCYHLSWSPCSLVWKKRGLSLLPVHQRFGKHNLCHSCQLPHSAPLSSPDRVKRWFKRFYSLCSDQRKSFLRGSARDDLADDQHRVLVGRCLGECVRIPSPG